jgi:RHS repeat-associated protein
MKNILLVLFCFCFLNYSQAHSNEEDTDTTSLATLEGEPSSIVHGCVSVITGDYVESHADIAVPGAEPLVIQRAYCSNPFSDRSMGHGWGLNHHGYLDLVYTPPYQVEEPPSPRYPSGRTVVKGDYTHASMTDETGSSMKFFCEAEPSRKRMMKASAFALTQGVTNCARGVISAKTNWRNTFIKYHDKKFYATTGANARYIFDRKTKDSAQKDVHRLLTIEKPNGTQVSYEYDKHSLTKVLFKNTLGEVTSWAKIIHSDLTNKEHIRIKSSTGHQVDYTFLDKKINGNFELKISGSTIPDQLYTYTKEGKKSKIIKKELPDNRFASINYFAKGLNQVQSDAIEIKSSRDLRLNRVKTVQEPVGKDATPITTCKLIYETNDSGKGSRFPLEGHTKVYDALNHQSIYYYNNNHRLTHVEKFKGHSNYTLYSRERLVWGANLSENFTRLICRSLEDRVGHIYFNRYFQYDDQGNILKDVLSGNITGNHPQSVVLHKDGTPSKTQNERFKKSYTYSADGLNLMLTETDGYSTIEYAYQPGTDLLIAQFLIEKENIRKRDFYDYDASGALISHIEDDGQTRQKENLQGVSERKMTTIVNTPAGLPKIIEDKYLDLATKQERLLHKIINGYDQHDNLESQSHYDANLALAYKLSWKYSFGQVVSSTNALGQETIFQYDRNGNKIFEQGPDKTYWTEYKYDQANRLIREEKKCIDGTRFVKLFTYDYLNRLTSSTNTLGNTTNYQYDEFGRIIGTSYPAFVDNEGQTVRLKVSKNYDLMGNVIEHNDACGTTTKTAYTIQGKPYRIEHADGTVEKNEYGIRGNLLKATAKSGAYTTYTYDYQSRPLTKSTYAANGTLLDSSSYTYNALHLISETDPEGTITRYNYDGAGRLSEILKEERKITYVYDSLGHLTETQEHDGTTLLINIKLYDLLDRVIEERTEDQDRQMFSKVAYQYDLDGNQIRTLTETQAGVQIAETRYNTHKEPIETIDALGQKVVHVLDYTTCDSLGQSVFKCTTTDPVGNQTITIKDAMDHIVSVESKNPYGQTIQSHKNYYNAQGRKVRQVETVFTPNQEPREVTTLWEYDLVGSVTDLIEALGTPEQKHTAYRYNSLGQLENLIKPDGCAIQHRYDAHGRLSEQFASDGSFHYRTSYDRNGNPIAVEDLVHHSVTRKVYSRHDQVLEETLGNGLTLSYSYDSLGRLTLLTLPDDSTVTHSYDPYRLKKVERKDAQNNSLYSHIYDAYDQLGGVIEASMIGKAGTLTLERDLLSRLISVRASQWKETIEAYDAHGNPLVKTIDCAVLGTDTNQYTYDDLQQLQTEKGHAYLYDSLYNRVVKDGKDHSINALNQLMADGKTEYEYDRCGRLERKITGSRLVEYAYDAMDRLISLTEGKRQTRYCYDADHRRLSKTQGIYEDGLWVEQGTVRYLYQGRNEIGICDAQGKFTELRVLGFGKGAEIGAAVAIECGGKIFAPVHDHNGSVVSLIDALTGCTEEAYKYTAFGEEEIFDSSGQPKEDSVNPWRYASKRVDEESGLVFFGRRYYDPEIGRWTTPDPIGFEGGANVYAYVFNSPLSYFDLYGLNAVSNSAGPSRNIVSWAIGHIGSAVKFIGDHMLPIPYIRRIVSCFGHALKGEPPSTYKTNGYSYNDYVGGNELNPKVRIITSTGILTDEEECEGIPNKVSEYLDGARVHYCYNSSRGLIMDLLECLAQKLGIPTHSVKKVVEAIRHQIKEVGGVGGGGKIYLAGHSQGGLIAKCALNQLNPEEKKMVHIRTFGSPSLHDGLGLGSATNYVNSSDYISVFDPFRYVKARFFKKENVVFMKSNKLFDHEFLKSDNYKNALETECNAILDKYGKR